MSPSKTASKDSPMALLLKSKYAGIIIPCLLMLVCIPIIKTVEKGQSLKFMIPNLFMLTPLSSIAIYCWEQLITYGPEVPMKHIAELDASEFSYERLKQVTNNFRSPAVVRGMFKDTPGVKNWATPGYLSEKIGDLYMPVVTNAGNGVSLSNRDNRRSMYFKEAIEEIIGNPDSKWYVFYPAKSAYINRTAIITKEDENRINELVLEELEIDKRIWPGFGTKSHRSYAGTQIIAGQGSRTNTTGSKWHCAPGNNWFIQVVGTKRWYFAEPMYSPWMVPKRGGLNTQVSASSHMDLFQKHIPLGYADIRAGDMLYNPDWQWHTIENYEGLSIGLPVREFNFSLSVQNNLHYTSIIVVNRFWEFLGFREYGGWSTKMLPLNGASLTQY